MGLKISKKQNLVFKIIFFSILGILVLILLKILIWENWYYQTKTSSIRNPEQAVITDIADASAPDETKPTAQDYAEYQVAATSPRYIEIPRLEIKARVEKSNVNENSMPFENGTVLISGIKRGISQNGAFANLDSLEKGDKITVIRGDDTKINYEVAEIRIIDREKAKEELPNAQKRLDDKETLSLITTNRANIIEPYQSIVLIRATKR